MKLESLLKNGIRLDGIDRPPLRPYATLSIQKGTRRRGFRPSLGERVRSERALLDADVDGLEALQAERCMPRLRPPAVLCHWLLRRELDSARERRLRDGPAVAWSEQSMMWLCNSASEPSVAWHLVHTVAADAEAAERGEAAGR